MSPPPIGYLQLTRPYLRFKVDVGCHKHVEMEMGGKTKRSDLFSDRTQTSFAVSPLFISSTTICPPGDLKAKQRTSLTWPLVPRRTAPGRTNLLKWAR